MRNGKKMETIDQKIAFRIYHYMGLSREILQKMVKKYIGEKYSHFASDDMIVLLEDYIDAHADAYEVCEALDKVKSYDKIRSELVNLRFEIKSL